MLLKKADPFSYLSRYKHNVLNTCLFLSRIVLFQEIKTSQATLKNQAYLKQVFWASSQASQATSRDTSSIFSNRTIFL